MTAALTDPLLGTLALAAFALFVLGLNHLHRPRPPLAEPVEHHPFTIIDTPFDRARDDVFTRPRLYVVGVGA